MKKILILILIFIPFNVFSLEIPDTYSTKILIYDLTDEKYIISKDIEKSADIASLTKILTVITAIENTSNLDRHITVTPEMFYGLDPELTTAGIKVGDTPTIKDLLFAAMLPSGSDACFILAHAISGSEMNFVKLMNEKAEEIGMTSSNFQNVTGLDSDNHYSTAEDIKKLLEYAIKNPIFKNVFATKEYILTTGLEVRSSSLMFGELINVDTTRLTGGKTGFTDMAGLCYAGTFTSDNHDFIIVTLNAPAELRKAYHIIDVINLITFIDDNYNEEVLFKENDVVYQIKVNLSKQETYDIKVKENITKFLPIDYNHDDVKVKFDGIKEINFLTKRNANLGVIKYYYQDELLYEETIYLEEKISISIIKVIKEYYEFIIGVVIGIFIVIIIRKIIKKSKLN